VELVSYVYPTAQKLVYKWPPLKIVNSKTTYELLLISSLFSACMRLALLYRSSSGHV
jgi:hypothetical protein